MYKSISPKFGTYLIIPALRAFFFKNEGCFPCPFINSVRRSIYGSADRDGGATGGSEEINLFLFLQKFRIGLVSPALPVGSGKQWIGRGKKAGRKKFRENSSPHHLTVPATKFLLLSSVIGFTHDNLCNAREPENHCL